MLEHRRAALVPAAAYSLEAAAYSREHHSAFAYSSYAGIASGHRTFLRLAATEL
ncbi:hypothetical protein AXF42_Ash018932 [Apostasia shenzhenica]|uniref:Uncharacterized protein n=1 Tax=Apostasia shenzhenica TaxID=1088818 RepID=A0A2I0B4L1_9ASPA|nr:hypothetical protein AXF42_Ash018932 [Apostasia shenzhenica]